MDTCLIQVQQVQVDYHNLCRKKILFFYISINDRQVFASLKLSTSKNTVQQPVHMLYLTTVRFTVVWLTNHNVPGNLAYYWLLYIGR